jgi:drug/metabolite transporter (DMT)-like permease
MNINLDTQFIRGALFVFIGAIFFSTKAVIVKLAYRYDVDSISLLALRMLFSLPFYLLLAHLSNRQAKYAHIILSKKDWILILLLGVLGYYLASLFGFLGLQYITASLERLILFSYPTLVLLIGVIFLKEPVQRNQIIALFFTYTGIITAFSGSFIGGQNENIYLGGVLIFFSALCYAIYLVGSGYLLPKIGTLKFTSLAMSTAAVAVIIHHGLSHQWALFHFPMEVYILGAMVAILATVIPSLLISEGIRIIGSGNSSIIGSVGPVSTIVLAYIFLDEVLNWIQWVGTLLVISGVLIVAIQKKST